jgi:AcrR family transcriptional regulator
MSSNPEQGEIAPESPAEGDSARAESVRSGRRREASERRRQSILEAARRCFGRHGYGGATVALIAEEAQVSNGLLYQFFRNKDHLFEIVLADVVRDWVREMLPRGDESASQSLEGMFRRSVDFCRTNPLLPALLSRDRSLQLQRIGEVGGERVQPHRDLVASILRRGIEAGEFRADLDVTSVADIICQLQSDYSSRAYTDDPRFESSPAIVDAAVRLIQDAVHRR